MKIGDAETFNFGEMDEGDEDRPPEKDVLKLTKSEYEKIFCANPFSFEACTPPSKPWFIAFVAYKRSEEHYWQSAYLTNTMKLLADHYDGKVQFAVVNSHKEERMRSTFGIRSLPAEFYYVDGIFYE